MVNLIDKNQEEDMKNTADLVIGFLPKLDKVVFMETKNFKLPRNEAILLVKTCIESTKDICELMNETIEKSFREKLELQSFRN